MKKDNKKIILNIKRKFKFKIKYIVIFLIIIFCLCLIIFFGWRIKKEINFGFFGLESPDETSREEIILESSLKFSDKIYPIQFKYFDLKYQEILNKKITDSVNLENNGNSDLILPYEGKIVELSDGEYLIKEKNDIENEKSLIRKNDVYSIPMSGITAEGLLKKLRENDTFFITFKPVIEYYIEGKELEKKYFNQAVRCTNSYIGEKLPLFRPACKIIKIDENK